MRNIIKAVSSLAGWVRENRIFPFAAQTSYYVIFSAIPFIMLALMAVGHIFPIETARAIDVIRRALPDIAGDLSDEFWDGLLYARAPAVSAAVVMMMWSASKWAGSLSSGLRTIYGEKQVGNYFLGVFMSLVYTSAFLCFSSLALGVIFYGNLVYSRLGSTSPAGRTIEILMSVKELPLGLMLSLFITLIHKTMAARRERITTILPGAITSALGWIVYSSAFSVYVKYYSNYSLVYGSLGLVIAVLLWVYNCVAILYFGAAMNVYLRDKPRREKSKKGSKKDS